jgi:glutamyl-tRNA reductase
MQLVCLSFHHVKTGYANFQRVRFEDPEQFYEFSEGERVLLQTGTRVEVYAYVDDVDSLFGIFISKSGLNKVEIKEFFDVYVDRDAALHLCRMAGSIESRVLGETYIPLAVESAFLLAGEEGAVGPHIEALFNTAIRVGERARAETKIEGSASVADIAAKLVPSEPSTMEKKRVVLLGAGTTGRKAAEALGNRGYEIAVVNRNHDIGQMIAQKIKGTLLEYSKLEEALSSADVLICATLASHYRVLPEMIGKRGSPLIIVDVSPFRNVSPEVASIEGVVLKNGELEKVVVQNRESAKAEVPKVEKIIQEEISYIEEVL